MKLKDIFESNPVAKRIVALLKQDGLEDTPEHRDAAKQQIMKDDRDHAKLILKQDGVKDTPKNRDAAKQQVRHNRKNN